jgi:UDP-glucose 4-epimerase
MMQFIHEADLTTAITLALNHDIRGVFNVTGPSALPLKCAIRAIGKRRVSLPEPLADLLIDQAFRWNLYEFPASALEFLKYPCTISGERFVDATGFEPEHSLEDIFATVASVTG